MNWQPKGCTFTWGYWKNHGDPSEGRYDDTWDYDLDNDGTPEYTGEDFFETGYTYYEIMHRPVKGNAYISLAHQYIGAQLNSIKEYPATPPGDVGTWIADAEALFGGSGFDIDVPPEGQARADVVTLAGQLAMFNEGYAGWPHCSD